MPAEDMIVGCAAAEAIFFEGSTASLRVSYMPASISSASCAEVSDEARPAELFAVLEAAGWRLSRGIEDV